MRFIGNIEAKADNKGRIFFPACFRRILQTAGEEKLMLRKDVYQSCLVIYPESIWNSQLDVLRGRLNRWNARHQMIFRRFVANVEELSLDGNGRILIPKRYLQMAGIEQEVRFIGMYDTIELWAKEEADKPSMSPEEFSQSIEEIMTGEETEE